MALGATVMSEPAGPIGLFACGVPEYGIGYLVILLFDNFVFGSHGFGIGSLSAAEGSSVLQGRPDRPRQYRLRPTAERQAP